MAAARRVLDVAAAIDPGSLTTVGYIVIRPDRQHAEYVLWDTEFETPVAFGDVDEIRSAVADYEPDRDDFDARIVHVDLHGSSAVAPYRFGWYDDNEFIYRQLGQLRRDDLVKASRLLWLGRDGEVLPLLQPFEDHTQ